MGSPILQRGERESPGFVGADPDLDFSSCARSHFAYVMRYTTSVQVRCLPLPIGRKLVGRGRDVPKARYNIVNASTEDRIDIER